MAVAATLDPAARPQAGVDRFAEPCDYDELVGGDQMVAESVRSRSVRP